MRRIIKLGVAGLTLVTAAFASGVAAEIVAPQAGAAVTHGHVATSPDIPINQGGGARPHVEPSGLQPIVMQNPQNNATAVPTPFDSVANSFSVNYGAAAPQPNSQNWAGYAQTGTNFTQIGASWTVPTAANSGSNQLFSSTWVGIDGFSSGSIIQTGTDQNSGLGTVRDNYDAWYELFPLPSVTLDTTAYPVNPGDQITANVIQVSGSTWNITLQDSTQRWTFATQQHYSGPLQSAEWIEEAPADNSGVLPLANFGTVTFTNLSVNAASPTPPPGPNPSGYDLVGSDGGVFVFSGGGSSGFYGSLPQLGISVHNIVGMVPSSDDKGYFLVGTDGGVFAFGDSVFEGSLPGLGVSLSNIRGIVPTSDNHGYFLVGSDGGVFAFGDAPYLGSLPGSGISRNDIIGIAATPSDQGYWLVAADGTVYAFGDARNFGGAFGTSSPVAGIASTPDGAGYWIVTRSGSVYTFGDANYFGSLPGSGVTPARPVIGLVPTTDHLGYWVIGSDGGIFAYGDAPFIGSLPAMGIQVSNVVGAVPIS